LTPAPPSIVPWLSLGLSVVALIFSPLVIAASRGWVESLIKAHDLAEHAHPNLQATTHMQTTLDAIKDDLSRVREDLAVMKSQLATRRASDQSS